MTAVLSARDMFDACKVISARSAAERAGLHLIAKGNKYWTTCFLHDDETPSMAIYDDDGGFYCYSCHVGGDSVKLYELMYKLQPVEAAKRLMADHGLSASSTAPMQRVITPREINKAIDDIRWRRINTLLNIKQRAANKISNIESSNPDLSEKNIEAIFAEVTKSSAAQDLINRIDALSTDELSQWVLRGAKIDDI